MTILGIGNITFYSVIMLRLLFLFILSFFIFPLTVRAEGSGLSFLSLEELLQIDIASYVEPHANKQPASITVISNNQLRRSGSRLLTHALTLYVPGYFFVDDQDDMIAGFRGLAPDNNAKVMVLVNGINMNIDWFWGANDALINAINFDWIDHVEVIRGPGSVTLGQGALLGAINIVTKGKAFTGNRISARTGKDGYYHTSYEYGHNSDDYNAYLYLSKTLYDGQDMAEDGWLLHAHSGIGGGTIADHSPKLNKAKSIMLLGAFTHHPTGIDANFLYADQTKDLYNFWFDRDRFQERLISIDVQHDKYFSENLSLATTVFYSQDDFSLFTNRGQRTGGTRESRLGTKVVMNSSDFLFEGNKIAIGFDYRHIESGKNNYKGDNFITNTLDAFTVSTFAQSNELRTWVNKNTTDEWGIFGEDFYTFNEIFTAFAAFRYDENPGWGNHISSRLGMLITPNRQNNIRLSYQNGFRGTVGLNYSGGHKRDGFLDEGHFDMVSSAGFGEENPKKVKPEEIDSYEIEWSYRYNKQIKTSSVLFYNVIKNVIDVGAFLPENWPNPIPPLPNIGDIPSGDGWGGFWYYKNNKGQVETGGFEASLMLEIENIKSTFSHSYVKIISADDDQKFGSMYVTDSGHAKAYPENVTRINTVYQFENQSTVALNYLYYYRWYSSRDNKSTGNHLVNVVFEHNFDNQILLSAHINNLLNEDELYPMNNNPGGDSTSDGTPSLESRTFWVEVDFSF